MKIVIYDKKSRPSRMVPSTLAFSGLEDLTDYAIIYEFNPFLNGGERFQPLIISWWREQETDWRYL